MRRKKTPQEVEHVNGQVATFRCGIDGCGWTQTTRLDTWLRLRDTHRAAKHPDYKPRKLKPHTIPGINKARKYMTEKEMQAWADAA